MEPIRYLLEVQGTLLDVVFAAGVEHLDVDVTWIDHSRRRVAAGATMLNDWAQGRSHGIERVLELPEALKEDIIRTSPDAAPSPGDYAGAVSDEMDPSWAVDPTEKLRARFTPTRVPIDKPRLQIPHWLEWRSGRYAHQGEAVESWEAGTEPEHGTIAMATGAGKTLAALVCATRAQGRLGDMAFLVIVSVPSIPLMIQWKDEVARFGITAVAPSLEPSADVALTHVFRRLPAGGTHVLIVTNSPPVFASFPINGGNEDQELRQAHCHDVDRRRCPHSRRSWIHLEQAGVLRAAPGAFRYSGAPIRFQTAQRRFSNSSVHLSTSLDSTGRSGFVLRPTIITSTPPRSMATNSTNLKHLLGESALQLVKASLRTRAFSPAY